MKMGSYLVTWRTRTGKVEAAFTEADNAAHAQHIIERHYSLRLKEVVAITELDFDINNLT